MALNKISEEIIEIRVDGAREAEQEIDALSKGLKDVESSTKKADKGTAQASQGFTKLQASIATAGAAAAGFQAAMAAAGAAMSAIKAPINLAVDFETQFNQIKTLNSEIGDDLRTKLLELAKNVPQTAGDLTSAAYQAISAGIDPGQVTEFLEAASKSAVAAGGSLTESVELLTAGVNAFGKQGETAASVADKLFATVKRGVTTIPELNAVFGRAAATAASYGIGLDEVLGAIATLTKQGLPTAEAVTRVNAAIKELSREGGTAAKALKKQGVQVGVLALQQKGLVGVLEEVNKATGGQANEISKLSTRTEAIGGMLALTGANMEGFRATVQGVANDVGASGEAFDVMNSGTQGAINSFNSLKEGVLRELGEQTLPALNELFRALSQALTGSSGATRGLGVALGGIIKTITFMIDNVGKLGITLTAAFAGTYATKFIKEVGVMRGVLQAFQAFSSTQGIASGAKFAQGFVTTAIRSFAGPALVGAIALAATTAIDAMMDSADEKAEERRERQRKESDQDLADFAKREGIRLSTIEARIKGESRLASVDQLRAKAARESNRSNQELADGLTNLTRKIDENKTGSITLADLYFENREAAEALIQTLNTQESSYSAVVQEQNAAIASAKTLDEVNKALSTGQTKLVEQLGKAEANLEENISTLAAFENQLETSSANVFKFERGLKAAQRAFELTGEGGENIPILEKRLKAAQISAEEAAAGVNIFSVKVADNREAIANAGQKLEENAKKLVENKQQIAEASAEYERNKTTIDGSKSAIEKEIEALRASAQERKTFAAGNKTFIDAIEQALQIQIKQLRDRERAAEEQEKAAKARRERSKKAIEQAAKSERSLNVQRLKNQEQDIQRETELAVQKLENIRTISLARLEAQTDLDELEKLEESRRINAELDEQVQARRIEGLAELNNKRHEVIEATEKEAIATIRNKDISSQAKDALIKAEEEKTRVKVAELDKRTKAETDAITREAEAAKKVADVKAPAEDAAAVAARQAREAEVRRIELDLMREDSQERRKLEYKIKEEEFIARLEQLKVHQDQQEQLVKDFKAREVEIERKAAEEREQIVRRQQASAADAVSGMFGDLAMVADAVGASDSFVGKLEAAQILAKGVYHAFQGASDQADALSAFATGDAVTGTAKQAAAIAHFAQAAAAPIMAAQASAGGGGGGRGVAGGAGGGGAAPSGPRRTSEERVREREEQRATIQFGDIVLSDIPALLSRQGQRALGQQIAGDVAREINRSRARPGGFRV
jgi:TP901 family phage tail tape measure protein